MNATDIYGLIGYQCANNLLPSVQRSLMAATGMTGSYEVAEIKLDDFPAALPDILAKYAGFDCAAPFQKSIMPYLAGLDRSAACGQSVSMVWQGLGYNTDLLGFLKDCPDLASHRVLLLGAGRESRLFACAAALAGAKTWILDQSGEQARLLAAEVRDLLPGCCVHSLDDFEAWRDIACKQEEASAPWALVNSVPPTADLPLPSALLVYFDWIYDTICFPVITRLALAARSRGISVRGGMNRLISQAVAAQLVWHPGTDFPPGLLTSVRRLLAGLIFSASPQTLILNGFMGSGKTTVGRILAASLNLPLTDLDQVIEQASGRTIPAIFAESGESAFRKIERRELARILDNRCSQILAVGGGALIDPAVDKIIHGAIVIYLDTPLDRIEDRVGSGEGRPLLQGQAIDKRRELYRQRLPRYLETADLRVCGAGQPAQVAAEILAGLGI